MPRSRTRRNSQFVLQIERVIREVKELIVPEVGALIECDDIFYVGTGQDWKPFAPLNNNALGIGWARYDDTEYTFGSPYNFTTTAFFLKNNARKSIDDYGLGAYNGTDFTLEVGCTYSLTIAFKAHLNTSNGHLAINLSCDTDADYSNIGDIIVFPKGNGIEHTYSRVFNFYVNQNAETSGLKIRMQASHSGSIYDAIYFIEKLSNG